MDFIKVTEQHAPFVALVELNRPKELNALNRQLMEELRDSLILLDKNDQVRVIILTGNEHAFAAESAKFGQPEIKLGTIPGAGGTQRLTKAVGKSKAMELVLSGRFLSAEEAHFYGLVSKIVPVELYLQEALTLAGEIAALSPIAVQLAKEAVNRSFETQLDEGLAFERKNFYLTFASADQKEGMSAFIEKRKPVYKGR